MIQCDKCDFQAKNANGLRLHSKKHKEPSEVFEKIDKTFEAFNPVRIKLFDSANKLILSYPVLGEEAVEQAKKHAENKGYRIEILR